MSAPSCIASACLSIKSCMAANLLYNPHLNEANNARMRQAAHKDQFAEILVFGDEHTLLFIRER